LRSKKGTEDETIWCTRSVKVCKVAACEGTVVSVERRIGWRTVEKAVIARVVVDKRRERCAAVKLVESAVRAQVSC
jgi:hypothetical protein